MLFKLVLFGLPLLMVIGFTVGYGLFLKRQQQKGYVGSLVLCFLNVAAFTYLVFFRE